MLTVLLTLLFFVLLLGLPVILNRRAASQVISLFKKNQALGIDSARTIDELGLRPAGFSQRLVSMRDYKPRALEALVKSQVVRITEDDRLYLDEEKLAG